MKVNGNSVGNSLEKTTMPCPDNLSLPCPDFVKDTWVWDDQSKPTEVDLSSDLTEAYFYVDPDTQSTGSVGVRGCKGFCKGEHYWEIIFLEPPCGTSMMVGVGTAEAALESESCQQTNLLGRDSESWGLSYKGSIWHGGESRKYCEPFYSQGTVIGVHLDLSLGQLTFYKDGVCMGPAFTGLRATRHRRLYPIICSTAAESELGLGARSLRLDQPAPLQAECLEKIRTSLTSAGAVDGLPLPTVMKNFLRNM